MVKIDLIAQLSEYKTNDQGNYELLVEPSAKQSFIIGSTITVGTQSDNHQAIVLEKTHNMHGLYLTIKLKY